MGSLGGSDIRTVTGRISTIAADGGAWNVLTRQTAISGHWSQSTGADGSGQHGMSGDIDAMPVDAMPVDAMPVDAMTIDDESTDAMSIDAVMPAFAGKASGAITSPTIRKIASSRRGWIERFTQPISHNAVALESNAASRNRQTC